MINHEAFFPFDVKLRCCSNVARTTICPRDTKISANTGLIYRSENIRVVYMSVIYKSKFKIGYLLSSSVIPAVSLKIKDKKSYFGNLV